MPDRRAGELVVGETEFCVLDLETTGFRRSDRIIEVACRRIDLDGNVLAEFETLINPDRTAAETTSINGIADRDLRDAPRFADISGDLESILSGSVILAHNASFDLRFLASEFERLDATFPSWPSLCTMRMSSAAGGPSRPTLTACCEYFEVEIPFGLHQAMVDVSVTAQVAYRILSPQRDERFDMIYGTQGPEWECPLPRFAASDKPPGRTFLRDQVKPELTVNPRMATGVDGTDHGLARYRSRLERAMEDRLIEEHELDDLLDILGEEGLSPSQAHEVHAGYFQSCVSQALADGRIDESERRDLERVAELLSIEETLVPELIATAPPPSAVEAGALAGTTVCFTGAVDATIQGRPITREDLSEAAEDRGMILKSGVSKKLNLLVTADPHSLSGKARKARDLGTRIITVDSFLTLIDFATD